VIVKTAQQRTDPGVILDVVAELLEANGYDKWQLDEVAEGARVSLATIYKHFPSRGELTVAALERWMEIHAYGPIESRAPGEPLFDALIRMLRTIFEPWEKHPEMLDAFMRARWGVGGERLRSQGDASVGPMIRAFDGMDPSDAAELDDILKNATFGALSRYVSGEIGVSDIVPSIERLMSWLKEPTERITRRSTRKRSGSAG
jgi:TetR/AcrR family transcriptional regulator, cholesterol catabolism regulator